MMRRFLRWVTDLDDIHDLAGLDDRMLDDIGVGRGDIACIVRQAADGAAAEAQAPDGEVDGDASRGQRAGWMAGPRRALDVCAAVLAAPAALGRREPAR